MEPTFAQFMYGIWIIVSGGILCALGLLAIVAVGILVYITSRRVKGWKTC